MIKLLIKQIWTQRNINMWLWIELIIVSLCLSYITDYLYTTAKVYFKPLGYDTGHVYRIYLSEVPEKAADYIPDRDTETRVQDVFAALARMRTYPGVENISMSSYSHPYNMGFSSGIRGIDSVWIHGNVFVVTPEYFKVFRIADTHGNIDPLVQSATQERALIISEEASKKFLDKGINPLNEGIKNFGGTEPYRTVRGICHDVRYEDFRDVYPMYYECFSEAEMAKNDISRIEFSIRINPKDDTPGFLSDFRLAMKDQLRVGNIYLLDITSFSDIRANYYRRTGTVNDVKTHLAGLAFLMLNIFMGVIGTFWIRTQQRRSEIGIQLALGSSRERICSSLIAEGIILLVFATIPAMIISGNILYYRLSDYPVEYGFTFSRFFMGQLITFILIALMITISVLIPARQAMKINPAEALHDE